MLAMAPAVRLAGTLDLDWVPADGDRLPPLWHWLYFLPTDRQSHLAPDGHARRGAFLPPGGQRRRVWGGGRLAFPRPLEIGVLATKKSLVTDVTRKEGRTGVVTIVTVAHEVASPAGPAVVEAQDLVYTDAPPQPVPPGEAVPDAPWQSSLVPDEALLFRFSALTFNAHRIHYDHRFATRAEGYPGLVVHGPLVALLLAELVRRNGVELRTFAYRARAPLFCGRPVHLRGAPDGKLAAYDDTGAVAMTAAFT